MANKHFSIIVIGAGHAGCEAALAAARLGFDTLLLTMNLSTIALMPCNPSIGGPGKGHLVREIGALGGEMPHCIDETCVQIKWLNTSKGAAIRSRRAQADKRLYRKKMTQTLFETKNLTLRQAQVTEIIVKNGKIAGIKTETGLEFFCERLIVTSGTYLNSKIIIGRSSFSGAPQNQRAAEFLSESLKENGIETRRLQTATPPRVLKSSVNNALMAELKGDADAGGFCWENRLKKYENQISCYLTFTDERCIEAVKRNLPESPLILENITNVGPKHCPSIDRKIMRFPNMVKHQIFVEPEGADSQELYLQGLTTGMPPHSQREIVNSVAGLEDAVILRYGYAIEYDALAPGQFHKTMENRRVSGLYTAGQINGTSGYEEAAAQGLIAGINAALSLQNKEPYVPSRTNSYIGVLADDLSTWQRPEPYRITPGHAEFRLNLRDDSAERRLINDGFKIGLVTKERYNKISAWVGDIENELARLDSQSLFPSGETRAKIIGLGTGDLKKRITYSELLRRPNMSYAALKEFLGDKFGKGLTDKNKIECVETEIKYRGYFERENAKIKQTAFLEGIKLPMLLKDERFNILNKDTKELLASNKFDDLSQAVRNNCLSRSELVILYSMLYLVPANSEQLGVN